MGVQSRPDHRHVCLPDSRVAAREGCPRCPHPLTQTLNILHTMAFMAMRKNLDERARRKELDAIFAKFDHNHNGRIYIKDFLAELKDHDIEISQAEVKKIMEFSDREGQLSRANFESYCRDSALMKSLDKNNDGIDSELEMTSKHEMAFKAWIKTMMASSPKRNLQIWQRPFLKTRLMLSWPSLIKTETENLTTGSSRK